MRILASDFGDGPGNECLEDLDIEVLEAFEVQTNLTHLVFPEPGQEVKLRGVLRDDVDDQVLAADSEARQACVARVAACVLVGIGAIAYDARSPHFWLLLRNPPADGHDGLAIRQLLGTGSGRKVLIDTRACGFGFGLSHRRFLVDESAVLVDECGA